MDKAVLESRKLSAEKRFADLGKKKTVIVEEMSRLQGEHRLLVELIEKINNVEKGEDKNVSTAEPGRTEEPIS